MRDEKDLVPPDCKHHGYVDRDLLNSFTDADIGRMAAEDGTLHSKAYLEASMRVVKGAKS